LVPNPSPNPIQSPSPKKQQEALKDGTISAGQLQARQAEQDQDHDRLEHREMARVVERVDQYVQQGDLTPDEGETVRKLNDIDTQQESGAIDAEGASRLRNSLMTEDLRTKLDRKIKGAIDHGQYRSRSDGGAENDAELSEDELKKGAVFGRVEMRVAGQMRRVPRKMMLEPVLRRGAKRTVDRGADGLWRIKER
jgi:hypothetical protein